MEKSKSGQPIYRYNMEERKDFVPAKFINDKEVKKIEDFIEKSIGKIDKVYHELVSDTLHLGVYIIPPYKEKDFYTLVTVGMSTYPMNTPDGQSEYKFGELMISLPNTWKFDDESIKDFKYYWPIFCLKWLARFVHEYKTWLGIGHTIPNGDPPEPFHESIGFSGMLLLPSILFPKSNVCKISILKRIHFYALHPLYTSEMNFKLDHGMEKVLDMFDAHKISEVIDTSRKPFC